MLRFGSDVFAGTLSDKIRAIGLLFITEEIDEEHKIVTADSPS